MYPAMSCTHPVLFRISANLNFVESDKFLVNSTTPQSWQRCKISRAVTRSLPFISNRSNRYTVCSLRERKKGKVKGERRRKVREVKERGIKGRKVGR